MKVRLLPANFVPRMTPASTATAQNASEKKMWTEYMNEAEKYDKRVSESWIANSDGLLVFGRPSLFFPLFIAITTW